MSCHDDLLYDDPFIGEGEGSLTATVSFIPMPTGLDTRAGGQPGQAVQSIRNMCVLIYKTDGELVTSFMANTLPGYKCEDVKATYPTDVPVEVPDAKFDEVNDVDPKTPKATFTYNNLPYGKYRIYAVANLGDLTKNTTEFIDKNGDTTNVMEAIKTEEGLKGIKVVWNPDVAASNTTDNVTYNLTTDQAMFGFFTLASDSRSLGFDAPVIIVNKRETKLHSWIKRTVSKVTIAFDPSGLKDAVSVYIRKVTIHDIPETCALGEDNKPTYSQLVRDGETIYYGNGETTPNSYTGWMKLQNGTEIQGSKDHKETDDALYFFENMQGDYQGQKAYLKEQIPEETGTSINDPKYGDDGETVIVNDWKDRVKAGTYIEVEGYYVSQNREKISKGPIKYRFMLGKNTTYNYDAERNYHYKLTLKFRGWANEADWHIVYDEITPTIFIPDPYYISYLYNQSMTLPVRIAGLGYIQEHGLHLHAQIIENNWIPSIEDSNAMVSDFEGAWDDIDGMAWNKWAYDHTYKDANYAGFLSLRKNTTAIIGPDQTYGPDGNAYLKNNYEGTLEGGNTPRYWADYSLDKIENGLTIKDGTEGDPNKETVYDVVATDEGSVTVNLPMFTRPKELIPASDFSGNNPFYAYVRKAVVRFSLRPSTAKKPDSSTREGYSDAEDFPFKVMNVDGTVQDEVKYIDITIYQVPRIVNPKGIWRKHNNDDEFHVQLMELDGAGKKTFSAFKSDGPWRVSILQDPNNLIELKDKGKSESVTMETNKKYIEGNGDTEIDFYYCPRGKIGANDSRCGIIQVEYNDYTCTHLIFVRQGYDKGLNLAGDGTLWSCYNAYAAIDPAHSTNTTPTQGVNSVNVVVTKSPLSIGSFFKRCMYNYAILEKNNDTYGWLQSITGESLTTAYVSGDTFATRDISWSGFGGYAWTMYGSSTSRRNESWADTWTAVNKGNQQFTVPTYEQYQHLRDNCEYGYGIVYADGATKVSKELEIAQGYTDFDNQAEESSKGMRVCILYNKNNGDQILFPLGATGQGRRAISTLANPYDGNYNGTEHPSFTNPGNGSLTYSRLRGLLYSYVGSKGLVQNFCRPLTYNLYREPGAVYWFKKPVEKVEPSPDGIRDAAAWDINYYTVMFNCYDSSTMTSGSGASVTTSSDALPIRLIYKSN